MGNVMTVPCRSYSAQAFDSCPACVDAALDAVEQAGIYLLGRTASGVEDQLVEPFDMSYRLKVRLFEETGVELAADEIEAEQTLQEIPPDDGIDDEAGELFDDDGPESSMRLDDFQTVLDRLQLQPRGRAGLSGVISGRLFAFERAVGGFEIQVAPGR
jgi:hypothetical protein